MPAQQATDNSHFPEKVKLRERFVLTGREKVLECFAGEGLIWDEIKRRASRPPKDHPD